MAGQGPKPGEDDKKPQDPALVAASAQVQNPKLVLRSVPEESEEEKRKKESNKLLDQKRKQRISDLAQLFKTVFAGPEWTEDHHGGILEFNSAGNNVKIIVKDDEVSFSGKPIEKVIQAAQAYEKHAQVEMIYEVDAKDINSAKDFMLGLQKANFDISKISAINCSNGTKIEKAELEAIVTELKAKLPPEAPKKGVSPAPGPG